jgi:hypothetical protein
MRLRDDEFPVVVQAYDPRGPKDAFVAEQVVYTQTDVDSFTSRYAGLLIKSRDLSDVENGQDTKVIAKKRRRRSGSAIGWVLFLLVVIIALMVWGFTTGWIQQHLGINPPI